MASDGAGAAQAAEPGAIAAVLERLHADAGGLTSAEAKRRLQEVGPNAIPEKRRSLLVQLASYFWGPIPWMIEVADLLSGILGHWDDLAVITVLLVLNAGVGFWQERTAADAVGALKRQLALRATALRDGVWREIDAALLVPGDVVRLRLGNIIPADVALLEGDYLRVDQSALTGESLPVDKRPADGAYSSSVAVQGEMTAVVTETGADTYFGRTTRLVEGARSVSHFQRAVLQIGNYLIWLSVGLVVVLVAVELARGEKLLTLIQFALILTVAAIPVALPAVLSVTMAVGALALSRMKAIVTHLESIEEMAGVDVLCTDKTGTLTQNSLSLGEPVVLDAADPAEVVLAGALASDADSGDAIDRAIVAGLASSDALAPYHRTRFTPFDPVSKRSSAEVARDGAAFTVTKGAPQVVLGITELDAQTTQRAQAAVEELARDGYRTLGVARREGGGPWRFLGLLPLSDPPREDSAETIKRATEHGIAVKMLTGDNAAIAGEIARRVGLGDNIVSAGALLGERLHELTDEDAERIESVDGFAEVFPEHKYAIVEALQRKGHIVGMTGDGVNDAPALKQADAGVAVAGATDAARAAADLVLTAPGLSVIVAAVEQARIIFERMNAYAIYRITETIRIILFVVAAMISFNFYPITAILIILLALFNDVPIMTIAIDNTAVDPEPVRWRMHRVLTVATMLGVVGVIETFGMLVLAKYWLRLGTAQIQSLIFLKLAVAGHLTLFVARVRGPFYKRPYPAPAMLWAAISTKALATALVGVGFGLVTAVGWAQIGFVWAYCIAWILVEDRAKLRVYAYLDARAIEQRPGRRIRWLERFERPIHPLHRSA